MKENTLLVIVGPTAIGKTDVAIDIAEKLNTEIISCDSRQIYKEMSIGTARPSENQLDRVKHYFIATQSIHDYYNASMFETCTLAILTDIFQKNKIAIMVGGSGLYVDAVCKGIDDLPTIDLEIRENILSRYHSEGIENLRQELFRIDPNYCRTADIRNPKRIFKALEVYYMTGKPYSEFLTRAQREREFNIIKIGLNCARKELYERIDKRVDNMINDGLIDEAHKLYQFRNLNALNTVGYKELFDYFRNSISLERAIELIKQNSRHYAKRQITWFARDKEIIWFDVHEKNKIWNYLISLSLFK